MVRSPSPVRLAKDDGHRDTRVGDGAQNYRKNRRPACQRRLQFNGRCRTARQGGFVTVKNTARPAETSAESPAAHASDGGRADGGSHRDNNGGDGHVRGWRNSPGAGPGSGRRAEPARLYAMSTHN